MPATTAVCVSLVFLPCGTSSGPGNRSDFKKGWPPSGSRAASAPWIERGRPTGGHAVNVPSGLDYRHGSRYKDRDEGDLDESDEVFLRTVEDGVQPAIAAHPSQGALDANTLRNEGPAVTAGAGLDGDAEGLAG